MIEENVAYRNCNNSKKMKKNKNNKLMIVNNDIAPIDMTNESDIVI